MNPYEENMLLAREIALAIAIPAADAGDVCDLFQPIRNGYIGFIKAHFTKAEIEVPDRSGPPR